MSSLPETSSTILPPDYKPTEKEKFMNPVMLEYFRQKLLRWRSELLAESNETIKEMQEDNLQKPDIADRASAETDHALELRARDRERKLISKINAALEKIEEGTYGYCEETGEPISVQADRKRVHQVDREGGLAEEQQRGARAAGGDRRHERKERTQRDMRE